MPLTRRPARSTFTFEIKRAHRRTPEVQTQSRTFPPAGSLAQQVFGKAPAPSRDPQSESTHLPAPARSTPSVGFTAPEVGRTEPSAQAPARRILPDLLSIAANPVEERVRKEAEARASRRKVVPVDRS